MRGLRGFRHRLVSGAGIAAVVLVTFLALLLQDRVFEGWRLDLTEDRIWTLSEGTRELLSGLDTDVTVRLFFSRSAASETPLWTDYARFVGDTLASFARASDGRLRVEHIDPEPLSDAAAAARAAGLEPIRAGGSGDALYLGIEARTTDGRSSVIARLAPDEDALLEFRLARLLEELLRDRPPRVALISGIALDGDARGQGTEIFRRLRERFELLTGTAEAVAAELEGADALVLAHPRGLSEQVSWAVDQYALAGGRILLLIDPLAERDPGADALAFANPFASRASRAPALLRAWGIAPVDAVVLDADHAMPVQLTPQRPPVRHLAMLALPRDAFATDDPVMARMEQVNLSTAGALRPLPGARTRFTPLITSASASALVDASVLLRTRDPSELSARFEADPERHVLAARVRGPVRSAFADLPGLDVPRREGELELIAIADTDLLTDALWLAPDGDGRGVEAWAGNGDLVINAVEQLAGSDALLGIRGAPRFARPLARIEGLRREAETRLLERLTQLENALAAAGTESPHAPDGGAAAQEEARLREEIRSVQRALTADVERLSMRAELIGVFSAPLLVLVLAALVALQHRRTHS